MRERRRRKNGGYAGGCDKRRDDADAQNLVHYAL